jgi:hypothetical protein
VNDATLEIREIEGGALKQIKIAAYTADEITFIYSDGGRVVLQRVQ